MALSCLKQPASVVSKSVQNIALQFRSVSGFGGCLMISELIFDVCVKTLLKKKVLVHAMQSNGPQGKFFF